MKDASMLERARESRRLMQIYNTMFRYVMEFVLDFGLLGAFRRRMQQFLYRPPQRVVQLSRAVKVRLMIQDLGPTFIKVGQIVSSRSESLPDDWQKELNRLQSDVPPFPGEEVRRIIVEDLGAPPEELFAAFELKPLAAASTAQVHRATLHGGQQVVVKVQRPDIQQQMRADLGIMHTAVGVAERQVRWMREIDVRGMLEEFGASALRELDYRGEAYNAHLLGKNLSEIPGVQVPAVYPQLSSARILTQQFIHGVKITEAEAIQAAGLDREQIARAYLRSAIKQLMVDGVFHGDPHPGNVLVDLDTGMITYIDLGMIGRMTVYQRINMGRLLLAIQQRNAYNLANVLRTVSTAEGEVDSAAYYTDFESRIGRYWISDVSADFGPVMNEMFDLLAQHGLVLDTHLTLAVKVLMQSDAITKRLFPAGELVPMAVDLLREQLAGAVTVERITDYLMRELTQVAGEVVQRLPTLEQATLKWLDQYERGQLSLKLDTSQLDETVDGLKGVSVQILVGLMLVGMIIGSAIAATAPTLSGRYWQLVPRLATGGYVFAMFIAGYLVLRLLWRVLGGK